MRNAVAAQEAKLWLPPRGRLVSRNREGGDRRSPNVNAHPGGGTAARHVYYTRSAKEQWESTDSLGGKRMAEPKCFRREEDNDARVPRKRRLSDASSPQEIVEYVYFVIYIIVRQDKSQSTHWEALGQLLP